MVFIHKCGREAKLNIADSLSLLASVSFSGNKLIVNRLEILKKETLVSKYSFFCLYCGRIVPKEEIKTQCMNCGNNIELADKSIPTESNGIYCKKCIEKRFSDEKIVSLNDYLGNIVIK